MITSVSLPPETWDYIDRQCEESGKSMDLVLGRFMSIGLLVYLADELAPFFWDTEVDRPFTDLVRLGQGLKPLGSRPRCPDKAPAEEVVERAGASGGLGRRGGGASRLVREPLSGRHRLSDISRSSTSPAPVGGPVKAKAKTPAEAPGAENTDKEASS